MFEGPCNERLRGMKRNAVVVPPSLSILYRPMDEVLSCAVVTATADSYHELLQLILLASYLSLSRHNEAKLSHGWLNTWGPTSSTLLPKQTL